MKSDKSTPNVPTLRFHEYTDEWQQYKLSDFVNRVTRRNKNNESTLPLTISAQYGLVDQITFFNKTVASVDLSGYFLLYNGDFAYNKSYSNDYAWGAVKRLEKYEKGCLSSLYFVFRPKDDVDSDFLTHYFETSKWHKGISDIAGEGARNHGLLNMSVDDYFATRHYLPKIQEQKKIAAFLNLIAKRIEVQNKIIEDLKILKKELMDFILNTNEFIEMSIQELIDSGYLSIIKASELKPFVGTREYLSTSSIGEDGIEQVESIISYKNRPSRAAMLPIKDSIWFAKMKNTIKVYQSVGNDEERYILSTGFYGLLCNKNLIDPRWLLELFKSEYFNSQKDRFSEGSSMSGIKDSQLADIKLKMFKNRKLESFHGDHIQKISQKIELEKRILKLLLLQKQFYLNAMFI